MTAWPEAVQRVSAFLRSAGVDARVEEFADGTPTADEAARAVGCDLAQIVKSVVFVADGAYVVALVPGDARGDDARIAAAVGARSVRVARPAEVVHATGFEPGAVAPFPHRAVSVVLMERTLLRHEEVWVGAGSGAHMAAISPADLQRLTRARTLDLVVHG